ncbi:MAG: glucans biosynthesis protein, partial [Hyphomicrobiales bacterium]|nr:glucans biosynthesis protein [Hyphomicrobiales bacterium]
MRIGTENPNMFKRRDLLKFAATSVAAAVVDQTPAHAQSPPQAAAAAPETPAPSFDPAKILDMARDLAKRPYKAPNAPLTDPFASLTYDLYVGIKSKPDNYIWKNDNAGFVIE